MLYYNITLDTPTCFDPLWEHHQGITLRKDQTVQYKNTHAISEFVSEGYFNTYYSDIQ